MEKAATQRDIVVRRIIVIEGLINLLVLVIKLIVGTVTGSLAVLGDSIHSLTDLLNNLIAWYMIRLSSLPPDREHPYGHRKYETIAVFGLATLLTIVAVELALSAFRTFDADVTSEPWGLALMLVVLVVNTSLALWQKYWANKLDSEILLADASHTFGDCLTTIVVICGWQLSSMGYKWLDKLTALGVAGLIFYLAYGLFKRVIPILVDHIAIAPEELQKEIKKVAGVRSVLRVRSRWIGTSKAVDVTVGVDSDLSTKESHAIADEVELLLEQRFEVTDSLVHIESLT